MNDFKLLRRFLTFFYILYSRTVASFRKEQTKSLIIVKIDVIGDYLLFRNFLMEVRDSAKYRDYKITLIGNSLCRDLYNELDSTLADETIWLDFKKYFESFQNKKLFIDKISSKRYSELITFHFSRTPFTELVAFIISAKRKIGMNDDASFINPSLKKITDKFYTEFFRVPDLILHEFQKNAYFTSQLLSVESSISQPCISLKQQREIIGGDYLVVAVGAGSSQRQLPLDKMKFVIDYLLNRGEKICFVGTVSEKLLVNVLTKDHPKIAQIMDLTGLSPLADLPYLIENSKFVICCETSIFHMAISLDKYVLCFAGGGHYSRFVDYGKNEKIIICNEALPCYNCNWVCIFKDDAKKTYPCISALQTDMISSRLEQILSLNLK